MLSSFKTMAVLTKVQVAIKEMKIIVLSETEKAWDIEARALNAINLLDHPHIMKSIAAIRRGEKRYFMFPWAENSLRDYWNSIPTQSPTPKLIREAIDQFRGLADALDRLHNFKGGRSLPDETFQMEIRVDLADETLPRMEDDDEVNDYANPMSQESIRHGDIKPENILRFLSDNSTIGTLKLGDMGLAKRHVASTEKRRGTSMRYGTRRYEGPETLNDKTGRSRLYDLWSMGCITFECILWLLYGNDALVEFYKQAEKSSSPSDFHYYKVQVTGGDEHPIVIHWMDHMEKEDPECQPESKSMLRDLLQIVREKLLVVDLPPTRQSALADGGGGRGFVPSFVGGTTRYRATAAELREALDAMKKKAWDPKYVCTNQDRSDVNWPAPRTAYRSTLEPSVQRISSPSMRMGSNMRSLPTGVVDRTISADYSLPPLKTWEFEVDNDFAEKVIKHVSIDRPHRSAATRNNLCKRCVKLNFWSSGFAIEDDVKSLANSAENCDLCRLLRDASHHTDKPQSEKVRFERGQSVITMTGNALPVLSLIRSPGESAPL
jgi:serine/threonine protein kinase